MSSLPRSLALRLAAPAVVVFLVLATTTTTRAESRYYATQCSQDFAKTWAICQRDGANRPTEPYLASLVGGEQQTGEIGSPPFKLSVDRIHFTIRGHDGPGGGKNKNFAALVDNKTGKILRKTPAPGSDALQERQWDVADLKGRTVRFQLVDGDNAGAFAWLGVEKIEAGPELTIDFRKGMPKDWGTTASQLDSTPRRFLDLTDSPVPFRVFHDAFTWIPAQGSERVDVGCPVERIYLLGCTLPSGHPMQVYGNVELVYADQSRETIPLIYGYTLELSVKTATKCDAACVRPVGDGTRYLVAIQPKNAPLAHIELKRVQTEGPRPQISAITCQLAASTQVPKTLQPLAAVKASPADTQWLDTHTISTASPGWLPVAYEIRRAHGAPASLADIQRLEEPAKLHFTRRKIADQPFEAASVCDIDGDGHKDIVSGDYWYAGPDFTKAYKFRTLDAVAGYRDSFHDYPMDVNGDGRIDIVTGGWFCKAVAWMENPKDVRNASAWTRHEIDQPGNVETTRFWDVDRDGQVEICPNAGDNVVFYRLVRDASGHGTAKFEKHIVKTGGCGHGLGFGDINGDGRGDFIIPKGWLEAPAKPLSGQWKLHEEFNLGDDASVPILVHDVNGDGLADLICGNAHDYGIFWLQQKREPDGSRTWIRHTIEDQSSQYHDMQLADLDGDGRPELVTGKRYYAHNGHDPGAEDPVFVRYFNIDKRGNFTQHTIDFGPAKTTSGAGIYFWVEDVNGDGRPDIVAPGKSGLYLFLNQ